MSRRIKDKRNYKQRGIIYLPEEVNTLKMHMNETLEHWITKALVFRLLRKLKHEVITEFEITGMGVGDVLDLTTSVQYEIETTSYSKFIERRKHDYERIGVEVIVIPLKKLPVGISQREKTLKQYLWE